MNLKVVFFGTPQFAKTALEAIHKSDHDVVGVVTVADKASGRGQKMTQSPVKIYAEENQLPVFQPEKLRNPEFLEQMRALDADIFVVVAFRMMPEVLFSMPKMGTFNLHASLLPDYRGAAPINYALINGEKETGVTTFFINEKIDEGNILLQKKVKILPEDNAGTLHDRLMEAGAQLIVQTLDGLAQGTVEEMPQREVENPKNAFKIFKGDTRIDFDKTAEDVYNFVRGMSPYPAAFTHLKIGDEIRPLKILSGSFEETEETKMPGTVEISKNSFKIYCGDGVFVPYEVQPGGKNKMDVKSFLNGLRSFEDIKVVYVD